MADSVCKKCLKILCLHGYRQSAQTCKKKLGAFRKGLKKLPLEFAPNKIPKKPSANEDSTTEEQGSNEYSWWFSQGDDTYDTLTKTDLCKGYQESLQVVQTAFDEQGPFDVGGSECKDIVALLNEVGDLFCLRIPVGHAALYICQNSCGIFAFSQGACFLSLLCALREQGTLRFDFAILVAGFKSRSTPHESLYSVPITCPSLHVFGDSDRVIPKENSQELLRHFLDPATLNHSGGHFVPAQSAHRKVYTEFLEKFLQ